MKKRKMAIFIAILVLGVGYAAVSNVTLNLNGTNISSTCYNNDYLFISGSNQWTINKSNQGNSVIYISNGGKAVRGNATSSYYYRPAVYLKSTIKIKTSGDGNGSINHPYELSSD